MSTFDGHEMASCKASFFLGYCTFFLKIFLALCYIKSAVQDTICLTAVLHAARFMHTKQANQNKSKLYSTTWQIKSTNLNVFVPNA